MSTLQAIWFLLIAVQVVGYTVLAGFDLGLGTWHLSAKPGDERRAILSVIGPFWDGNQVWLVTAGAALFAAFPPIYATAFSSLYLALMLLLFALVVRTVAIEYGAKSTAPRANAAWGAAFAISSMLAVLLLGTAFGNILRGLPLNADGDFTGTFFTLLNPFALLIGLLNLALLSTHGALYLALKAKDTLAAKARAWAQGSWCVTFVLLLTTLVASYLTQHHLLNNYLAYPVLWILPILTIGASLLIAVWNAQGRAGLAFGASVACIALLLLTAAAALFPVMIPALGHPEWNLTAINSSSSPLTLKIMFIIALIGLPIAYAYTIWTYRVFRGKIRDGEHY